MSNITVATFTIPNSHGYSGTVTLRLWFTGCIGTSFKDSLNNIIMCGVGSNGFYVEPTVTVNGSGTLTIPQLTLPSTDNSSNIAVRAHAQFYVNGAAAAFLFQNWIITSTLGASITYAALYDYNVIATTSISSGTADFLAAVSALISTALGTLNDAAVGIKGRTALSVNPLVATNPVAIGTESRGQLVNVREFVTAGLGTLASPWTGWDTAITWAAKTTYYFPAGYYGYATSPNWALADIQLIGDGPQKTFFKFTGSGIAMKLDVPSGGGVYGPILRDFTITGNASCTTGLYLRAIHHVSIRNVEVRNLTGACLETHWSVLGVCDNFRVSVNEGAFTTTPTNGMLFDKRGAGEQTTAWSIINPVIEHVSGDGIVGQECSTMTFFGGTSEGNGGMGILFQNNSADNTVISMDCEANTGEDYFDNGISNAFLNCLGAKATTGTGKFRTGISNGTLVNGGRFNSIQIDAGTHEAVFHNVKFNFEGSGTIVNNGINSDLEAIRNVGAAQWATRPNSFLAFDEAGTPRIACHVVANSVALSGGTKTVNLAGDAQFSSSGSYQVVATDITAANAVKVATVSGSQFILTGTGADVIYYIAIGN